MDDSMTTVTRTPAIGDLQGQQNMAISECLEAAHALRSRLEPVRTPLPEKSVPTDAPALQLQSPIAAEILNQTERIFQITTILRAALSEIEL